MFRTIVMHARRLTMILVTSEIGEGQAQEGSFDMFIDTVDFYSERNNHPNLPNIHSYNLAIL